MYLLHTKMADKGRGRSSVFLCILDTVSDHKMGYDNHILLNVLLKINEHQKKNYIVKFLVIYICVYIYVEPNTDFITSFNNLCLSELSIDF